LFEKTNGHYVSPESDVYIGELIRGKPNGQGVLTSKDQNKVVEGTFIAGKPFGEMKITTRNPQQVMSSYYIRDQTHGIISRVGADKGAYKGCSRNGQNQGVWKFVYPDGHMDYRNYVDGVSSGQAIRISGDKLQVQVWDVENGVVKSDSMVYKFAHLAKVNA